MNVYIALIIILLVFLVIYQFVYFKKIRKTSPRIKLKYKHVLIIFAINVALLLLFSTGYNLSSKYNTYIIIKPFINKILIIITLSLNTFVLWIASNYKRQGHPRLIGIIGYFIAIFIFLFSFSGWIERGYFKKIEPSYKIASSTKQNLFMTNTHMQICLQDCPFIGHSLIEVEYDNFLIQKFKVLDDCWNDKCKEWKEEVHKKYGDNQ